MDVVRDAGVLAELVNAWLKVSGCGIASPHGSVENTSPLGHSYPRRPSQCRPAQPRVAHFLERLLVDGLLPASDPGRSG